MRPPRLLTRAITAAASGVLAAALPACAATLDAAPRGNDIVFTWDTGLPDTILRGTTPDALVPWRFGVTSPFVALGENLTRGENAFYRLQSGSNMASRAEVPIDDGRPLVYDNITLSLPERRAYDARELFNLWPALVDLFWWDGAERRYESMARFPDGILGDDDPLPRHGGVSAVFLGTGSITIVGSHDDTYAGPDADDLWEGLSFTNDSRIRLIGVPAHARDRDPFSILCGQLGVDWFDVNGDGKPDDQCGTDTNGDGYTESGLYRNCQPVDATCGRHVSLTAYTVSSVGYGAITFAAGQPRYSGVGRYTVPPGIGMLVYYTWWPPLPASEYLNLPWRPPTW